MKQGISIERTYDLHDRPVVRILKRRGRLTLEEVSDLLRLEGGGEWSGWYAVLLNCTEGTIGGNGLYDSEDPKGDAVDLYEINEGDDCPICGKFIPPFQYCPSCGAKWSDADQNVETLLASMMEETRRMIAASSKEDGRRSAAEVAAPRSSRKESQNPEEVPQPHPALCFRGSGCGRRWRPMTAKCVGCGLDWNVSIYQKIPRTGYICPHCESRLRAGETLPNIQASQKARPQRTKGATP